MKKLLQVIMLPTNNPTFPCLVIGTPELGFRWTENKFGLEWAQYFHLYICSQEEIKEGDWYWNERLNQVFQAIAKLGYNTVDRELKVIATTDSSLNIHWNKQDHKSLPSIPEAFIKQYITRYNEGSPIKKVLVEYEEIEL